MTSVVRNMECAYTSDVEDILKLIFYKVLKSKLHVRSLIINRNIKILPGQSERLQCWYY
jgi:hypothetical protein